LVLGSGGVGLSVVLAARAAGAGEVIATYRHRHQGEAALALGARTVLAADEVGGREIAAAVQRQPIDIVVETVGGRSDTLEQALNLVRPGDRVAVLGVFTRTTALNPLILTLKEVRLVGCSGYCRPGKRSDFDTALGIIAADPERVRRAISHRFPLSEAAAAYAVASDKSNRSLKVLVLP
ncbi:MAG: zinc-binding dehydrogenase, partial [Dehalococcoidia bacterium]